MNNHIPIKIIPFIAKLLADYSNNSQLRKPFILKSHSLTLCMARWSLDRKAVLPCCWYKRSFLDGKILVYFFTVLLFLSKKKRKKKDKMADLESLTQYLVFSLIYRTVFKPSGMLPVGEITHWHRCLSIWVETRNWATQNSAHPASGFPAFPR